MNALDTLPNSLSLSGEPLGGVDGTHTIEVGYIGLKPLVSLKCPMLGDECFKPVQCAALGCELAPRQPQDLGDE
jgi:hypothetical protein